MNYDGIVEARILSRYLIPISPGNDVTVDGPFPLSADEWVRLMVVLEAMHPGLIAMPDGDTETEPPW